MKKGMYGKMKRRFALIVAVSMMLSNLQIVQIHAAASNDTGVQFYVSQSGKENAAGTLEDPFRTLEEARDAIREMKQEGGLPNGGVTVNIRGGEYALLEDSFKLEAEDSGTEECPIVYQAYDGEEVKFVGNIVVSGSKFVNIEDRAILDRLADDIENEVLVYDLEKENGLTEFDPIPKNGYGWPSQANSMSVLVDGESQTIARYPNSDFLTITTKNSSGFIPRNHLANPDGSCPECTTLYGNGTRIPCTIGESGFLDQPGGVFTVNNSEVTAKYDLWSQENDIWTAGYFCWDWADDNCAIESIENTGSGIKFTMAHPTRYGVTGSANRFYVWNLLCEIDQPGEWYLDRENAKLYLYPGKDITDSDIELTMQTKPLVTMENVSYVDWQNITFAKSNGHGITIEDCDHVEIAGCVFEDLGQRAICIGDPNDTDINTGAHGGSNNTVRSCDITRMGQGGIFVGGGNRYTLTPGNNKVVNCDISDFATIKRTYSPGIELMGCGNSAERNEVYDAPHLAIQFKGNDMLIYGNDIHNVCYETSDCGAIYTGRKWSGQGNVIQNNFIHDMINIGGIGSAAVYVDDLYSGVTMKENLLVNVAGRATLFGGGRDNVIANNIQINYGNGIGLDYDARGLGWGWYMAAGPDGECYGELVSLRSNAEYDQELWDERYPGLADIDLTTFTTRTDKGDGYANYYNVAAQPANVVIQKNIMVGVSNPEGYVDSSVKNGSYNNTYSDNVSYEQGTEIGFADAAGYDFRVQEGSTIEEMMGDDHFQVEMMGLYEDEYRTIDRAELDAAVLVAPQDEAGEVIVTNGVRFIWKNVEGAGSYKLEVAEDEEFKNIVKSVTTLETSASAAGLEKNKTYYWRVTARENAVNGAESLSAVQSFTTSAVDDDSFYEGFRDFSEWETLVENGTPKGSPSNTTAKAHFGCYSYELNEGMDVIQKVFPTQHNDVVSIWIYDNMNKDNGAAGIVNVTRPNESGGNEWIGAGISVATNGGHKDYYVTRIGGTWYDSTVKRSEGWHELKWDYSQEGTLNIYIDDVLAQTLDAPYYDRILIGDFWNHSGYAGDISGFLFDDLTVGEPQIQENVLSITLQEDKITLNQDETYQLMPIADTDPDIDVQFTYSSMEYEIARVDENGVIQPVRPGKTIITVSTEKSPMTTATAEVEVLSEINLEKLQSLYDTLITYVKQDYTEESWKVLEDALIDAYEVLHSDAITVEMRDQTIAELENARNGLVAVNNLVGDNFGFELGTTEGFGIYPVNGDGNGQASAVKDEAHSGEYSGLMQFSVFAPWDGTSGYQQMGLMYTIPGDEVQAGKQYEVSYWTKTADGRTRNMVIRAEFRNGKGSNFSDWVSVGEEWTKITYRTPVVPEGLDRLEFMMGNQNIAGYDGQYYIDDVSVSLVSDSVRVNNVALDKDKVTLTKEGSLQLNASVAPQEATNDIVVWSTSDSSIVTVENGNLTAVNKGTAVITVTTLDGNYQAQCEIVVIDKSELQDAVDGMSDLTSGSYTDESWADFQNALDHAIDVLKTDNTTQDAIDEAKEALMQAHAALTYKEADYTEVDEAIAKANALNKENYKDFSAVEAAVKAVVRGKDITEQDAVDAMAKAIKDAIAGLEEIELPTELPYVDVSENDWFYSYVYDVYVKELMTGLEETVFGPNNNLVRAQFAVIIYRMEGEPEVTFKDTFPDVRNGQFYSKAVIWAAENGIVTGYTSSGLFGPNDLITREQMATMMFRYANYKKLDTSARENLDSFPDGNNVQKFATDAVRWCAAEGIITGKGEEGAKILDPQGNTVRAECATIISRYTEIDK